MHPGTLLGGRYRVEGKLGSGGMGTVYRARDVRAQRSVAVKTCDAAEADLEREARLLAGLAHPNVVRVLDVLTHEGASLLVMELVEGQTLQERLDAAGSALPLGDVLSWAGEMCDALAYLHGHEPPIVFRDLKPSNLIIDVRGVLRLVDFGIARASGSRTTTHLRGTGTDGFAPLEQYVGGTDAQSDIYALGATLYTLLRGVPPPPAPARALGEALPDIAGIPGPLQGAIRRMLALKREERPRDIGQVRILLSGGVTLQGGPVSAAPFGPVTAAIGPNPAHPFTEVFRGVLPLAEQALLRARAAGLRARLVYSRDVTSMWPGQYTVLVCHPWL